MRLTRHRCDARRRVVTRVEVGGKLSDRKGVSLPDTDHAVLGADRRRTAPISKRRSTPASTGSALSFIQRPEDIAEAKKITRGRAAVMAKIEKPQAVTRLDEIIDLADALMVARGDLGVEMPLEKVPGIQKQITRAARRAGKPVVVATQMLEIDDHQPGADPRRSLRRRDRDLRGRRRGDAVGGIGGRRNIPVEAVATMNRIAEEVESDADLPHHHQRAARRARGDRRRRHRRRGAPDRRDARSRRRSSAGPSPARPACASRASGRRSPIVAISPNLATGAQARRWSGACTASSPRTRATSTTWSSAPAASPSSEGFAKAGQRVIIVAGVPLGTPGATNMLRIAFVGPDAAD